MISKIVHYCEFGEISNKNYLLDNWKQLLTGYIFIRWNEANFRLEDNPYAARAYAANRIDLLENYVRVWALYNFGGIALDVNVELIQNFDSVLPLPYFIGLRNDNQTINQDVFGSTAGHEFFGKILEFYNSLEDSEIDITLTEVMTIILGQYYYFYADVPDMFVDSNKYITLFTRQMFSPQTYDYQGKLVKNYENEYSIARSVFRRNESAV